MILVIATRNMGKLAEFKEILSEFPITIKSLYDFGHIPEVEEDGMTFEENAYKKASFTSRFLGMPILADDSGLVVEALDGAPGVYSARYAGAPATDEKNLKKLLSEMKEKTNRKASFECVISIAVPNGQALTYQGRCDGIISDKPKGDFGFGYDPVFYYPLLKKTFAQMTSEEKNAISHRGKALGEIKKEFDKVLIWIGQNMPENEKLESLKNKGEI